MTGVSAKTAYQPDKLSAVTLIIGKVCQAGKHFSAFTPVICKVFRQVSGVLQLLRSFEKFVTAKNRLPV
jgi:hypothetical protein